MKNDFRNLFISTVNATPLYENRENEDKPTVSGEDYRLIPDGNYKLHLIDVNAEDADSVVEPAFVGTNDIVYRLFTRSNPTAPQTIRLGNTADLQNSFFNPNHQSRFHVHGWLDGGSYVTAEAYRDAYLAQGDFNFFAVDWSAGRSKAENFHLKFF